VPVFEREKQTERAKEKKKKQKEKGREGWRRAVLKALRVHYLI
jgi:carbamate kinase